MVARCASGVLLAVIGLTVAVAVDATEPDHADDAIRQFLIQGDSQPAYRATRHLEAENGDRKGWLEAVTEYSPVDGFRYTITSEGGSSQIRTKVLQAVLDGERDAIAEGETKRSSLAGANYTFKAAGVDHGLATVLLSPRRKEPSLVSGRMLLQATDGRLVRLEGRLARSPSFWVKNVDIVRRYDRIHGAVVPVELESRADVRFLGGATLRMTYTYSTINGQPVTGNNMFALRE